MKNSGLYLFFNPLSLASPWREGVGSSRAGQKECYEVVGLQDELSGMLVVASGWPPPVRYAPGTFTCYVRM